MNNTQKGLMLAVVFTLASGQTLQAYWRDLFKKTAKDVASGAQTAASAAVEVTKNMDPATQDMIASAFVSGVTAATGRSNPAAEKLAKEVIKTQMEGGDMTNKQKTDAAKIAVQEALKAASSK